ncbi:hypothetical protein COW36_11580 [bacterium (Candidatus Blackallbacteria) CG17_big_fil_post_rev_8_21_14_2_50_48_46]|uniref:Photosynthesis system II assembly factor Ycf48/Hcf136-like domain-containing protein n=1 Tax=bacterium (Candidatus Blackallbacteria) CG17_big_fil_post_rev_8_21_14_2_50_48_46 TaxID=2014261 RepID=A0A2M7G4G9_9BACT|nr:MAG: hypothetical protein COW64_21800 [bacterium (Candidatus Blackallbacteria) CG18_big_fil_WC_8_21_14_2_50_49_26]PIW16778.1 MAG: hypothetical protein COW36_11580 [bacterium (Candidatus Blackallbacteria) CG17_big_fil_post_rev_8_21_14_2_50_48_46]PIW49570.1 MAG: hypothetical protein COW20_05500 [bacterium (Candidatus Blackallbacteria) CG13_big_fil_rev_8_21_14_2_50_49_14]
MQNFKLPSALLASALATLALSVSCASPTTPSGTPKASPSAASSSSPTSPSASANPSASASPDSSQPSTAPNMPSGWSLFTGSVPCSDKAAIWWDNDNKGFWGCGKSGNGGFSTTTDGGMTWTAQRKFDGIKVQGITRDPNGQLYISGQIGSGPVATVNESNPERMDYTELYARGKNAYTSVAQGEGVAVTSDGQILVDSLTGTTAVYSPGKNAAGKSWFANTCTGKDPSNFNPDASNMFCELHGVGEETMANPSATAYQITAVQAVNDKFYATGRKINEPAQVRMPSKLDGATFQFQTVQLQKSNQDGEMLDMVVWQNGRIVTVGTDQTSGAYLPLIYLCSEGKDCNTASSWQSIELDLHGFKYSDSARDGRAVDGSGDIIVVVGNFVPNSIGGWAVMSDDAGKTWKDLTPELTKLSPKGKLKNLYDVKVFASGKIMIYGEDNFVYQPSK